MTYLEAIRNTLLTTENTLAELGTCLSQVKPTKKKNKVLEVLSESFDDLFKKYIEPVILVREGRNCITILPRYKKGEDDLFLDDYIYKDNLLFERKATEVWVKRKEEELKAINLTEYISSSINNNGIFPTFYNNFSEKQLDLLYKFLTHKDNPFIKNCSYEKFSDIFFKDQLDYQPKIHWIKGIPLFQYFFYFMDFCEIIDITEDKVSSKLHNGQFFVNAKDKKKIKPFYPLSKIKKINKEKRKLEVEKFVSHSTIFQSKELEEIKDFKDLGILIKSFSKK